jgi:hypothetical protein
MFLVEFKDIKGLIEQNKLTEQDEIKVSETK